VHASAGSPKAADRFLGPAVLLQAHCWIMDSHDEASGARWSTNVALGQPTYRPCA
jgi:succinate dehydrogenase/fumarate reductase-like Fe-S protein